MNFEKHPWQSPMFVKSHASSLGIPFKIELHHGCFPENFDKLLFTMPVKTHIEKYL